MNTTAPKIDPCTTTASIVDQVARIIADNEVLIASRMGESVIVTDSSGGRWHPSDEAEQEIMESARPLITAVLICDREPMRGCWVS